MAALVDIVMTTFNHEPYIGEAIESVFHQICDFQYRLIIADDCSTDGTQEVCAEFEKKFSGKILRIVQPVNVGLAKNYDAAFRACTANFIAILEGDDVWTDLHKLQKQVDILQTNPCCGLVHTAFDVREHTGQLKRANLNLAKERAEGHLYEAVMRDEIAFCPLTVLFRRSLLARVDYDFCIRNNVWTIDAFLWPEIARQSEVRYLPEVTGIYRRVQSAATSTRDPEKLLWYFRTGLAMKLYYLGKYPVKDLSAEDVRQKFLTVLVHKLIQSKATQLAIQFANDLKPRNKKAILLKYAATRPTLQSTVRLFDGVIQLLSAIKQKLY